MPTAGWFAAWTVLLCCTSALRADGGDLEYPSALRDAYDADDSCWIGMGVTGEYPVAVVPEKWLVGPPPSELSAVTMPTDHWVELLYRGRIVGADGTVLRDYKVTGRADRPKPGTYHVFSKSKKTSNPKEKLRFDLMVRFTRGVTGAPIGFHTIPVTYSGHPIQSEKDLGRAIGMALRGPYWNFYWPWEVWPDIPARI